MENKKHKNQVKYNPFENSKIYNEDFDTNSLYPYKNPKNFNEASVILKGNLARMAKLLKKASEGNDINIAVLGGSITEGSGASDGEYYGDLLNRWFQKKYPQSNIKYTNVGRGTTTSLFGCARIERDIEPLNCDMVVVEYSVNDLILEPHIAKESFEAILRKLLSLPTYPFVFVLFSCMGNLGNTQNLDIPICQYYDVPCASLSDALKWHLKEKFGKDYEKNMSEQEISEYIISNFIYDGCHPNTYGYSLLADFIIFCLEDEEKNLSFKEPILPIPEKPLYSLRFMNSHIENNEILKILNNNGWEKADKDIPYIERGFTCSKPGSSITFSFNCKMLTIVTRRSISPKIGIVSISVDGEKPFLLDGYFHNGWGTHNNYRVIIDSEETKTHTVTITFTGNASKEAIEKAKEEGLSPSLAGSKFIISEFLPS